MSESITTRTAKIWLEGDHIMFNHDFPSLEHSIEDARENVQAYATLSDGKRRALLVDMSKVKSVSREARAMYADSSRHYFRAVALVVGSPLSRAIGNFFLGINRTQVPTKLFGSADDARVWLLGSSLGTS